MLFSQNPIKLYSPIKWAGNKHFILNKIRPFIEENNMCHCFYECFAGSLSISLEFQPRKLVVVDRNYPLINMWKVIKNNPIELCELLSEYSNNSIYNNRAKYEEIRDIFNIEKMSENMIESIEMAVHFIYLNKRSFNGLYRENQNGKYNVPYREYKNTKIYDESNILNISKYFNENDVSFYCKSYNEVEILPNSFVYLDPPYYESNTSSFTAYTKEGFTKQNHCELFEYCNYLNTNGIKFLQSNSPCSEIMKMYNSYNLRDFYMGRSMRSAKIGNHTVSTENNELFIWNNL